MEHCLVYTFPDILREVLLKSVKKMTNFQLCSAIASKKIRWSHVGCPPCKRCLIYFFFLRFIFIFLLMIWFENFESTSEFISNITTFKVCAIFLFRKKTCTVKFRLTKKKENLPLVHVKATMQHGNQVNVIRPSYLLLYLNLF